MARSETWPEFERTSETPNGFDVTCVIGRVEFDATGDLSPHEAAFLLIARHDTRGEFNFPMEDGRTMSVTVDYPDHESEA